MPISNEEFTKLADECGVGIKLMWRMDGIEYGFATFGSRPGTLDALRRAVRLMMATLYKKGVVTASEWDEFKL